MVAPSHLKALQALELAVRLGSLKGAADVLSITPAAVGQRVKSLEDYLGIDLLVRGRSGLQPTAPLQSALSHLNAAFRELDNVAAALDLQRTHEIHLACASDFAELWLMPRLRHFRERHPNISFCINGEGDAPLRLGAVDCEISFGAPQRQAANTDILFRDFVAPIGSPENTQRVSSLSKRGKLEGFPLLHLDFYRNDPAAPDWAAWIREQGFKRTAPERGIRFQRITLAVEAMLADAGFTICGLALISEMIDDERLSLPFPIATGVRTDHAFQAQFRADAVVRPQVRRFRDWMLEESEATRRWLSKKTGQRAWA